MGARDRVPRGKNGFHKLKTMVREAEDAEYLYSNENKEFTGTAVELLQAVYRCESLPVKIRLYAATKSADIEPKPIVQPIGIETEAEKEKRHKELDEWLEGLAHCTAREVARHLTGKRDPKAGGSPAIVVDAVKKVMAELEALAAEEEQKAGHAADTVPLHRTQHIDIQRKNGAAAADKKSVAPETLQPPPAPNGAHAPGNGSAPKGRVSVGRVLYGEPHRSFWLGHHRLDANEHGEIDITDASPGDIEQLERHGYRARR